MIFKPALIVSVPPRRKPSRKAPPRPEDDGGGMTADEADRLVAEAVDRLWSRSGASALDGLRRRGLTDEMIRAARLGFDPSIRATTRDGRPYGASGVVIPWMESGRLALVKVRQGEGRKPKYVEVYRDDPCLYVAAPIRPGRPVIVCEGELDALIVAQQTAHLACGVITTGSASNRPDHATAFPLLSAPAWIIATDADEAGDRLAEAWVELVPGRCRRARPPGPGKDWTDAAAHGFGRIAYHLAPLVMTPPSWESRAEAESIDGRDPCRDAIALGFDLTEAEDAAEAEARRWEKGERP